MSARAPRRWVCAVSSGWTASPAVLTVLAAACVLAVPGMLWTWGAFRPLVGAATAVLNPALTGVAADRFRVGAPSGRTATQVSATTTLTAVVAAPVLAGPAVRWGWGAAPAGLGERRGVDLRGGRVGRSGHGLAVVTPLAAIAAVRAAVVLRESDEPFSSGTETA